MRWFRMYYEARTDNKLKHLDDSEFRVWFNLLCFAAEQEERGVIPAQNRYKLAVEVASGNEELLERTLDKLCKLDIISNDGGTIAFIHFKDRQYDKPSDYPEEVRERVRRHRGRKSSGETPCNAPVTPGNAIDTDTDTDTERDTDTDISLPTGTQDATEAEREVLNVLKSVPQYKFDYKRDLEHIRTLAVDYPSVDLLAEAKKWRAWRLDNPKRGAKNPRLAFRNWCEIAQKRLTERRQNVGTPGRHPPQAQPAKPGKYANIYVTHAGNGGGSDGGRGPPA